MLYRTLLVSGILLMAAWSSARATPHPARTQEKKLAGYNAIVLQDFSVDKNPATEDFPKGLETMMHSRAVAKVRDEKVFNKVIDAGEAPATQTDSSQRSVVLNGTVMIFDKGSRAGRYWVGFGAGQAKLKVRFVLTDAGTGAEVMHWDQIATFKGTFNAFGGSQDQALTGVANGVVKGLIKQLRLNR